MYIIHVCYTCILYMYVIYYTLHIYVIYYTLHMYVIYSIIHYTCMYIHTHSAPGRVEGVEIKSRGVSEVHVTWQPLPSASITTYLVELSAGGRPYKLAS